MNGKRKEKGKRLVSLLLVAALLFAVVPDVPIQAVEKGEGTIGKGRRRPYVMVMKGRKATREKQKEIGNDALEESGELADNNVIVAELTEAEYEELQREEDVVSIEEDLYIESGAWSSCSNGGPLALGCPT